MAGKKIIWGAAVMAAIIAVLLLFCFGFSPTYLVLTNGDTGEVLGEFPVQSGDEFSVSFVHSVNNSSVTDVYEIRGNSIYVIRTVYYAFGAGVQTELDEGQTLEYGEDGAMIVSGFDKRMDNLSYIVGTVSDHVLEINGRSVSLRELCGKNTCVRFSVRHKLF
ncbi:MAG TPA: DUF1850 domain-containing protein [Thermoclostridium caenicola]|nr:DUF1850 domain-containing protein [Thermoclostridium caenicola]